LVFADKGYFQAKDSQQTKGPSKPMNIPAMVQAGLTGLKTVYALVNSNGQIASHDPLFPKWISAEQDSMVGLQLLDVLPEFMGQEQQLEQVSRGDQPFLRIDYSGRAGPDGGQMRYLHLVAVPGPGESDVALVVLVTDVTEQGQFLQALTQSRNELRLARHKMTHLTYQLDYLLRHYVPAGVADALLAGNLQPNLGGDLRPVTVLFADVRGFTTVAEQLSPEHLIEHLNNYWSVVADAINEVDGTISQFQGDNVLAIFNAPEDQPDHAWRAVQAGLGLQQAVSAFKAQQASPETQLDFGVGINTGPAVVGHLGARWRHNYTAIGDTVNLAARITDATPAGEIWISQTTRQQLPDTVAVEPLPAITFKGKSRPTALFLVRKPPASL
jgi:adenylate cyclase